MVDKRRNDLFRRLTALFRGGPTVKRKVKSFRSPSASTAVEVFKKSYSQVYSNALNAYGQYDRMCLAGDTMIPVPGEEREVSISELSKRYTDDEKFLVYAYDHEKKQIVPAYAHHPRQSGVKDTVKITFDDGTELICTHDHPCLMRSGEYKDAGELKPGTSMMPFYRKSFTGGKAKDGKTFNGYQSIYTMDNSGWNGWVSEHKLIAEWFNNKKVKKHDEHVHHVDYNPSNNSPSNLVIMDAKEHLRMHASSAKSAWENNREKIIAGMQRSWDEDDGTRRDKLAQFNRRPDIVEKRRLHLKNNNPMKIDAIKKKASKKRSEWYLSEENSKLHSSRIKKAWSDGRIVANENFVNYWTGKRRNPNAENLSLDLIIEIGKSLKKPTVNKIAGEIGISGGTLTRFIDSEGYKWKQFKAQHLTQNHKVISVIPWEKMPVFDMTVDGHENFATKSIIVHNSRYADFSEMEYTPEISSALDIYSEESASSDEKGDVFHVYSENPKIQAILDELFHDTLNIDHNLTLWTRHLVKYGDFFLFNDVHPEMGIINAFPIPVNEVEREEGWDPSNPLAVRFRWVTQGNQVLESWQVSHFRLMGNDAFLPYGASVLESARRIWRQLILIEDAMLVYRVIRSPERRVFYIDVGSVAAEEIPNYMEAVQTKLKRAQVVDKSTGRVDLRYNPLPVAEYTKIPLLDGTTKTIKELSLLLENNKVDRNVISDNDIWVYSIDDKTNKPVPGKVIWCGKNYTAKKLYRVYLDDGTWVDTAGEHPFILRDGSHARADELHAGDSLMPLYRTLSSKDDGDYIEGYEKTYDPSSSTYEYTHKWAAQDWCKNKGIIARRRLTESSPLRKVTHHVNCDKRDNRPQNLQEMDYSDHKKWHQDNISLTLNTPEQLAKRSALWSEMNKTPEHRAIVTCTNKKYKKAEYMAASYNGTQLHKDHNEIRSQSQYKLWSDEEHTAYRRKAMTWIIPDDVRKAVRSYIKQNPKLSKNKATKWLRESNLINKLHIANSSNNRDVEKIHINAFAFDAIRRGEITKRKGTSAYITFRNWLISQRNHKVSHVEVIDGCDVYCMTVVGPNGEDDRHNFAVAGEGQEFIPNNGARSLSGGIYLKNSVDEDYYIPVRGGDSGTKIDTLAGGQHISDIADVEYIQKKLFSALKVPKAYLGYDEMLSSKATLAQEDIRFSRTISRIQRVLISELNKIAMIHLFAHGYESDDLIDFKLHLSNPSTVAQQQKLELYRTKMEIAGSVPERIVDRKWVRKEIMGLTDDAIREIEKGIIEDKRFDIKIDEEGQSEEDFDPMGGGSGGFGGLGGGGDEDFDIGDDLEGELGDDELNAASSSDTSSDDDTSGDEDLFAGEDKSDDRELITDEDDEGKEEEGNTSLKSSLVEPDMDEEDPLRKLLNKGKKGKRKLSVNQTNQAKRVKHNRSRHKHHGPSSTHMPDFKNITKFDSDPFDKRFFNGDIFGRLDASSLKGSLVEDDTLGKENKPKIGREMQTMLSSLERSISIKGKQAKLLSENNDSKEELAVIEDIIIDVDVGDDEG